MTPRARVTAWLVGCSMVVEGELRRLQARHRFTLGDPGELADRPRFAGTPPVEVVLEGPCLTEDESDWLGQDGQIPLVYDAGGLALRLLEKLEAIGMRAVVREVAYATAAPAYPGCGLDAAIVVVRPELAGTRAHRAGLYGRTRKPVATEIQP